MTSSRSTIFVLLPIVLLVVVAINLALGSVNIPFSEIFKVLAGLQISNTGWETIILEFRLPKALTAVLAGSGLALSGLMMQTLFRNPLAGPFVLGISSGASLGVALLILASHILGVVWAGSGIWQNWATVLAAIAGSGAVLLLIVLVSLSIRDSMTLLIIGLMVGSLSGALVSVLQYYSEAPQIQSYLIWTFGSLGGVHGQQLAVLAIAVLLGLGCSWLLVKPLNALLLGDTYARSMGLNLQGTRLYIILVTALLAGSITAFCGPLAFIGIAIPHLARVVFKTSNHRYLVPGTLLLGAIVMVICDMVSQIPGSDRILPINAITSLIGAPAVIAILIHNRQLGKSFAK